MKLGLGILLGVGMFSASTFANTLDINLTPTMPPTHHWPGTLTMSGADFQFEDQIPAANVQGWQPTINLSGVTGISVTWNAPVGFMYAVTAPPANLGTFYLDFALQYGEPGQAASLGQVTGSSISMNLVSGSFQPSGGVTIDNNPFPFGQGFESGLYIGSHSTVTAASGDFAFTSITITANFNGTSPSGDLTVNDNGITSAYFFGVLYGAQTMFGQYNGPGDPGQLLTLEPLPSGSVPDQTPSAGLAAISALGLLFLKRQMVTA